MGYPAPPPAHRRRASLTARVGTVVVVLGLFAAAVVACAKLGSQQTAAPAAGASPTAVPTATGASSASSAVASPTPTSPPRFVFPVQSSNAEYAHTHSAYPASDILAACGTPVVAVTDGVILEVNRVDRWDPATDDGAWRGGKFLSILGDDGVRYYGAHFSVINDELAPGVRVAAGQSVGQVGTTGLSSACHLHFGISPPCGRVGDWWNRRGVIWPWRYLDAWRAGASTSAAGEISSWVAAHGCPTTPPA